MYTISADPTFQSSEALVDTPLAFIAPVGCGIEWYSGVHFRQWDNEGQKNRQPNPLENVLQRTGAL